MSRVHMFYAGNTKLKCGASVIVQICINEYRLGILPFSVFREMFAIRHNELKCP